MKRKHRFSFRRLRKVDYRHWLWLALLLGSGALTALRYCYSVLRTGQAFRDLALSFRYYFVYLFTDEKMTVTVNDLPAFRLEQFVPFSVEDMARKFRGMWALILDGDNFLSYLASLSGGLHRLTVFLLCILPLAFLIPVLRAWLVKPTDTHVGEVRRSVRVFQRVIERPVGAVLRWVRGFLSFLFSTPWRVPVFLVWVVNLNMATIAVEALAFYFYFVMSLDFWHLVTVQPVKLLIDAVVMFSGAPLVFWLTLAAVLLDRWRKKEGFARLDRFERKNREFMEAQPLVLMVTGTMGKKKTTALTDIALSEEIRFRDKALELMLEQFAKYPDFPFVELEREFRRAVRYRQVYSLTTARAWAEKKAERFRLEPTAARLYGYEIDRYRLAYNDNLSVRPVTDMVADYVCLFFIYTIQSSLIVSNYSVRTDATLMGENHFPVWDSELFRRKPELAETLSKHAHILDYDILRLGRTVLEANPNAGAFEFGVVTVSEVGKERGNNLVLQEMKRNTEETNQKNDLFNTYLKMCRHPATVCNFPFVRILTDEQRPESWGADARDLCSILHIKESGETACMMPLFFAEDLLHDLLYPHFKRWVVEYRHNRSDVTLPFYIISHFVTAWHRYRNRIYNLYGTCILTVETEDGTMDGEKTEHQYYLSSKKIYSERFATDCFRGYFEKRSRGCKVGLDDLKSYKTTRATMKELHEQHSYFIGDMETLSDPEKAKGKPPEQTKRKSRPTKRQA